MKYIYAYKTSDGVRHEDAMDASSREEVFNRLRANGIKAIKVVASDGSKANGEVINRGVRKQVVIVSVIATALFAGLISHLIIPTSQQLTDAEADKVIHFTSEESRMAFKHLETQAAAIIISHQKMIEKLEFDQLSDYQLIERTHDATLFTEKIKAGYRAVDASRIKTRDLFKAIFEIFPADCETERTEAQRLYAQTMDALDLSENRIVNDEKAFKLLDANRTKWRCIEGKVVWSDVSLSNEFAYFRRDVTNSSVRRRKDFNVVESDVIEVRLSE